jgi:hypothetical protein
MAPIELAFLGVFPNPHGKGNVTKKLEAIKKGEWEPDTEDYRNVVSQSKIFRKALSDNKIKFEKGVAECPTVRNFLAAVVDAESSKERPVGGIKRIDLVTHGSKEFISLNGVIIPGNVGFAGDNQGARLEILFHSISETALNTLDGKMENGDQPEPGDHFWTNFSNVKKTKKWNMADVRKKFAKGAKLVIYGCEIGQNRKVLQHIANTFSISVGAFKVTINYRFAADQKIYLSLVEPEKKKSSKEVLDYRLLDDFKEYYVEVNPSR